MSVLRVAAAALVAVAILVAAVLWFGGTDTPAGQDDATARAPGTPALTRTQPELARGNVVLLAAPGQLAAARRVASGLAGPSTRTLAAAGQAVLVRRRAGQDGILALAFRRELVATAPGDTAVSAFVERWLGRGTGG